MFLLKPEEFDDLSLSIFQFIGISTSNLMSFVGIAVPKALYGIRGFPCAEHKLDYEGWNAEKVFGNVGAPQPIATIINYQE
jgi:hypothetical protein